VTSFLAQVGEEVSSRYPCEGSVMAHVYDGQKMRDSPYFQPKYARHPATNMDVFVGDILRTEEGDLCKIENFFSRGNDLFFRGQRIAPCSEVLSAAQLMQNPHLTVISFLLPPCS